MTQTPNQETEVADLKQSVALLTALLARGEQRATQENSGEPVRSASLIAHEKLTAKVALALKPRCEIPPESPEDYVTITLLTMHRDERHPDYSQSFVGLTLHDPVADEYVQFGLGELVPAFIPARFWQGAWPRESNALNNLMAVGAVTAKPGVTVDRADVAKEWGEALGSAYMFAGSVTP